LVEEQEVPAFSLGADLQKVEGDLAQPAQVSRRCGTAAAAAAAAAKGHVVENADDCIVR
jgi:hypothetical protein